MGTAYLTIFGLDTPADSDCYGLRALMQSFAGAGDVARFFAYDDPSLPAKLQEVAQGYDRVVLAGHSHGGAAVKWILDRWSVSQHAPAALAVFFDPAPEQLHFGQFFSWQAADANLLDRWHVPLSACKKAICFYQRNEQIAGLIGVCGVPFVPVPIARDLAVATAATLSAPLDENAQVQNINVTGWGLLHCHLLSDTRVQAIVQDVVREVSQ
jgi:hypothetical protein